MESVGFGVDREIAVPESTSKAKSRIARRNEEKILDAALEVIAEMGVHGATMDRIAQRAEMSKPNLHYYFNTKSALYLHVLRRTLAVWEGSLRKLDPAGDPASELGAYVAEKVETARLHPAASRVFAGEILAGAPVLRNYLANELRALTADKAAVIETWIAAGKLAPIDPYHLIFLIWSATQHYADFMPQVLAVKGVHQFGPADFAAAQRDLVQIILRGALPR